MVAHQLSATSIDLLHAHFIRGIFILAFSYFIAMPRGLSLTYSISIVAGGLLVTINMSAYHY